MLLLSFCMKVFLQKNHRLLFYGLWLLLALFQAGLTELQDDEAYYWVFSKYMDWGYFDHPPMTALLVKMGYAIFPNELGVRLFPLLLNVFSLVLIEKLTDKKNPPLFYIIALSLAILQISGFEAVPDIPLIFFTALFFLCYKKFFDKQSGLNTLLLGLSIALLFYTKYHAVLIVVFTLLSNIKLFTKPKLYIAGILTFCLFIPHLLWQWEHNWISFRYHLFESNVNAYKFSFTAEYLLGQLLLPGPIAGFILLPAAFLYNPQNKTEKALKYNMVGIYIFFLLSSFRGKVEANWTSPVIVSIMVLSHQSLQEKLTPMAIGGQKWLFRLLPITLFVVLFARIIMIEDILPVKQIRSRYHSWKEWSAIMKEKTKGLPIVFSNSYQRASKYWFYSGQMTCSQNLYKERRNNYNFWPIEDSLLGKPVFFLDKYNLQRFHDSLKTPLGWIGYKYDPSWASLNKVKIIPAEMKITARQNDSIVINAVAQLPQAYYNYIASHTEIQSTVIIGIYNKYGWIKDYVSHFTIQQIVREKFRIAFFSGLSKGNYYLRFAIGANGYNPTHNSEKIKLIVK